MKTIDELIAEAKMAQNAIDVDRPGIEGSTLSAAIHWNKNRHCEQWQPKNAIAFLEAFKAMREALWGLDCHCSGLPDHQCSKCGALAEADRVLESL